MDEDDPVVHVCKGPPVCDLQGDEAITACLAGCPFCVHITVRPDGSTTETTGHGTA